MTTLPGSATATPTLQAFRRSTVGAVVLILAAAMTAVGPMSSRAEVGPGDHGLEW